MHTTAVRPVGDLLRMWRQRRGRSQLNLALHAEISSRHLSFIETGRSRPSRVMLVRLAERLEIPLRERNALMVAAGFAPLYAERTLDDPALRAAREAVDLLLAGHEPFPAMAIDRHWTMVARNRAITALIHGAAEELLEPPINALRLCLHPAGLAPRIENLAQWREGILARVTRQVEISADAGLEALRAELGAYPGEGSTPSRGRTLRDEGYGDVVVPFRLRYNGVVLNFLSTRTVFGTAVDVTLSELAIEAFFPADARTAEVLRGLATRFD